MLPQLSYLKGQAPLIDVSKLLIWFQIVKLFEIYIFALNVLHYKFIGYVFIQKQLLFAVSFLIIDKQ